MIADPKVSRSSYGTWLGEGKPPMVRGQLEGLIDAALGQSCKNFDNFLVSMKAAASTKPNMLIDIQAKMQQQFYADHTSEIISCETAKRYFDSLGLKKLPSIQSLKQEYAMLLAENRKLYPEQKKTKAEMMKLLTAKHNVMQILGLAERDT